MDPKTYIKQIRNITIEAAATELGVSRPYLSDVLNNKVIPSPKLTIAIEKWSEGQIPRHEMRSDLWPPEELNPQSQSQTD